MKTEKKVLIINGANLCNLGKRDNSVYGSFTLDTLIDKITDKCKTLKLQPEFVTSNCEGQIIDAIIDTTADAIIINAGAYSHYSYAIADALRDKSCTKIEVHISNIYARESFRQKSVLSSVCDGVICGLGINGYLLALESIKD